MNYKKIAYIILIISLILTIGCKVDSQVTPNDTLTANAGEDQDVLVNEKVQLDGSSSRDSENNTFTFKWEFTRLPAGSAASITESTTAKPHFTPDKIGEYEIELIIENKYGKASDKVRIKANTPEPAELKGPLTSKTILTNRITDPGFPDYVVMSDLMVQEELIIEPGVVIAFNRDKRMEVLPGGVLIAEGTDDKMIRFTGIHMEAGYWQGIMLRSANSANMLNNVIVEFAGSKPLFSTHKAAIFISGQDKSVLSVKNSFIGRNDGFGIYLQEGATFRTFSHNLFLANSWSGLVVDADNIQKLDRDTQFEQNGRNVVEIIPSTLKNEPAGQTVWKGFEDSTPYRLQGNLTIDGNLKLAPGVIIEMARNGILTINQDALIEAKGTETSKIKIRGAEEGVGFWRGILSFSQNTGNILEYVEISGGGSTSLVSGNKTNIAVYGSGAVLNIRNSKISHSGGYGVFVNYQARINNDIETSNLFEANTFQNVLKE